MSERPRTVRVGGSGGGSGGSGGSGAANGDDVLQLEGWLSDGEGAARGAAVIASPHPEMGGCADNPVVLALARGIRRAGMGTLRFNFRGVGRSGGSTTGDDEAAAMDYRAALDALVSEQAGPYVAAGYSFGAAAALRVAPTRDAVRALVLVAPPMRWIDIESLAEIGRPVSMIVGSDDQYTRVDELRRLVAGFDHVDLCVLERCDHFFAGDATQRIVELAAAALS